MKNSVQLCLNMVWAWPTLSTHVKKYAPAFGAAMPIFTTWMLWTIPSALCYYWTCTNLYSVALDLVLRIPSGACHASSNHSLQMPNSVKECNMHLCMLWLPRNFRNNLGWSDTSNMSSYSPFCSPQGLIYKPVADG